MEKRSAGQVYTVHILVMLCVEFNFLEMAGFLYESCWNYCRIQSISQGT